MLRDAKISRIRRAVFLLGILAVAPSFGIAATHTHPDQVKGSAAAANSTYVGSAACSRCHLGIANTFAKASMGHSLTAITPEFLKTLPASASYYDAKSNHHFEVHAENGKLYQGEFETGADGKEVFRSTHEMTWIIGTGENGRGALLRRGDYLFQAPLSYYTKAAEWNLSPGYQNGDYGFNRIIQPGCIACHSGRPQPVAGFAGKYDSTAFTQTSVGCENCHGPGSAHVAAMGRGEEYGKGPNDGPDPTIVNPARLKAQLADDICMSCHQLGDARVLQPGRTYQDFRPGQPLDRTVSIFEIPPTRDNPPSDDHLEHFYSMSLSKCFRATRSAPEDKRLRCISCHDPHVEPTAAEAPGYFNGKCVACHTAASCTGPQQARQQTSPADNCIGCHMPKREIRVISHSSDTNHRIVARPDEPFPDETFTQTTAAMPDLIHLNPEGVRGAGAATPPALTRLQAYAILEAGKPQYEASWMRTIYELETAQPENALVQAALGHRDLGQHKFAEAIDHLQHALRLDPLQPAVYADLSEAEDHGGQVEEAIASARKAVELDPFIAVFQKTLVFRLINGKRYDEAQAAMEKYLENFPEDDFMRKMLAIAKQ
jgi:Cytochrome c554 and c-prime/Tetratricopeptide repeat